LETILTFYRHNARLFTTEDVKKNQLNLQVLSSFTLFAQKTSLVFVAGCLTRILWRITRSWRFATLVQTHWRKCQQIRSVGKWLLPMAAGRSVLMLVVVATTSVADLCVLYCGNYSFWIHVLISALTLYYINVDVIH